MSQSFNVCVHCKNLSDVSYNECEACRLPVNGPTYDELKIELERAKGENKDLHADIDKFENSVCLKCDTLRKQLALAREALVEVANKDGFTIFNESEEHMSGSAQAFCDVATIAIEALAALDAKVEG